MSDADPAQRADDVREWEVIGEPPFHTLRRRRDVCPAGGEHALYYDTASMMSGQRWPERFGWRCRQCPAVLRLGVWYSTEEAAHNDGLEVPDGD